jgi:hypothetical protein
MQFFFFLNIKTCLENSLGLGRMKTKCFFFFEKGNCLKSFLKFFENVLKFFFWNISEKTGYFNTGFVFYSVNIQPDIMQNW